MDCCCSRSRAARRRGYLTRQCELDRIARSFLIWLRCGHPCIKRGMIQAAPNLSVTTVAEIVRLAVAPVFLLSGIGAFLHVCASRLSRIIDRSRAVEPRLLESRGAEHDRWLGELRVLDRRMSLVGWAISVSVLS